MTQDTFVEYHVWLKQNPCPDLQTLVAKYGGYHKITPEGWALYDQAMAEWQARRLSRLGGPPAATALALEEMKRNQPLEKKRKIKK